jgi:hypothetical protein
VKVLFMEWLNEVSDLGVVEERLMIALVGLG